jgi:hypothetical protein
VVEIDEAKELEEVEKVKNREKPRILSGRRGWKS